MQHHAADELDVEWPHTQCAPRRLPRHGESLRQQVLKCLTAGDAFAVFDCLLRQFAVAEALQAFLEGVDAPDEFRHLAQQALISAAEHSGYEVSHSGLLDW